MFMGLLAVIAVACSSGDTSPGARSPTPYAFRSPGLTAVPSELAADAGWKVTVQAIDETPGRAGYDNLDATLLLQWGGPGLGTGPTIGASVTSSNGQELGLQATVFSDNPLLVPEGYSVPAEVIGEWPTALPAPQLRIFSTGGDPFHELSVALNEPLGASSPLPLPSAAAGAVLEVSGEVRVTPSLLSVAHWAGNEAVVFARHGTRSIEYGNNGDFWQVSVGVTVENPGSVELPVAELSFEVFDDTWAEAAPDLLLDPRQSADSIPANATRSFALSFQTEDEPKALRLVTVLSDAGGTPSASSVAGYDAVAVAAGKRTFGDLLTALDQFQATCATAVIGESSVAATMGTSTVEFAGASDQHGALIRTSDTYRGPNGEQLGSAENTYVLARSTGSWQVQFTTASPSGETGQC
jgi:hypothetical protein